MGGVEYQVTKVDPTNPETKGMVYQVHKVTEEVAATLGGKVYRARIINDPTDPAVAGKVYQIVLIGDPSDPAVKGKVYNAILTGDSEVVVVGPAVSPLSLPDAIADSLSYVKAFGGTKQQNLPDGYIERQFIYMLDGSYLLTDIVPTYDGKIEMDFATTSLIAGGAYYFLGGRTETYGGILLAKGSNGWFLVDAFGNASGDRYTSSVTPTANTRYKFTFNNKVSTLESGGSVLFTNTSTGENANGAVLCINGLNANGSPIGGQVGIYLYSFKAWNGQGELVADYVPAIQKGTVPVVGFYDMVSGTFKTATAGTFAAGGEAVPTPDAPMDIVSNNGVLRIQGSATGTVTQAGTPTPTEPIYPVFYQKGNLVLRAVDGYADTYDATTQTITRNVGVRVLDGTESWVKGNVSFATQNTITDFDTSNNWSPICTHGTGILGSITPVANSNQVRCNFSGGVYTLNLSPDFIIYPNIESWKAFLADQYAAGTPVIIIYPLATPMTESFTPSAYADGTVETIEDTIGNTATAEMLLKVGDYQDVQSILDGVVTRNVGVKVLDGTEDWVKSNTYDGAVYLSPAESYWVTNDALLCTHFHCVTTASASTYVQGDMLINSGYLSLWYDNNKTTAVANTKAFLADQYAAGTPVIVVYPLKTATTESVAGQTLQVTDGDNALEITQASLSGLELEAEYEKEAA